MFKIPALPCRSFRCNLHGEPFEKGSRFISTLTFQGGKWIRRDYCLACWEKKADKESLFWERKIEKKEKVELFELFQKLQDEPEKKLKAIFLFALLLERRREFVRRESSKKDHFLFEHLKTGEHFLVERREPFSVEEIQELSSLFN